ncbi:MAG: UDP-glucose/GDP-mannose dehydrogenase family protein [Pseudomonadota bacterium]
MKVTIFGSGYVGLVTGACLAEAGNTVVCMDVDQAKIDNLNNGRVPIFEPGLEPMVAANMAAGRLKFTADAEAAVSHGEFQFIAVGTPPDEDGSADLQYVLAVARSIGEHMQGPKIIVDKSTVPVGTADRVAAAVAEVLTKRGEALDYWVVSNPEFLKEGAAIDDCQKPDRIVLGTDNDHALERMKQLYAPFNRNHDKIIAMDVRSAELTKYAANAMLATKISFMNEMANLAERVGADIEQVRRGIGSDPRIGFSFIYPGCGYGGSCFPKDVQALARTAAQVDYDTRILNAVESVNETQKQVLLNKMQQHFGDLTGRTVALWGLAFKPNTDDMRSAPSRTLMEGLWNAGARVRAYDPEAAEEALRIYGERSDLKLCDSAEEALEGADALAIVTEWRSFWSPDFDHIAERLRESVIFDGRNLYDPKAMAQRGITYYAIGRGESAAA